MARSDLIFGSSSGDGGGPRRREHNLQRSELAAMLEGGHRGEGQGREVRLDPLPACFRGTAMEVQALRSYEAERLAATSPIVLSNRQMAPEQVIDLVAARAPQGFTQLDDVISRAELEEIAGRYRKVAGFERERLSRGQA